MIHVFYKNRHTIWQFMIALMFVSGAIFMFTFDGAVSESQATGCCGGGEAEVTFFATDSSGGFGGSIPTDTTVTDDCCGGKDNPLPASSFSNSTPTCPTGGNGCSYPSTCQECKNNSVCSGGAGCTEK